MKRLAGMILICFGLVTFSVTLTTIFQDAPPKYVNGDRIHGIAYDILNVLKQRLKKYNIEITWNGDFKNMGEIQKLLQDCKIDFFVGMAKTSQRLQNFIFSRFPVYSIKSLLLLRKESRDISKVKIGIISSTKTSSELPQSIKNYAKFVKVKNIKEAIDMLLNKEIDGVFYNSMSLGFYYLKHPELFTPVLMLSKKYYQYIVFSHCVSSAVVETINRILQNIIKDGEIDNIIKKYHLERFVSPPNEISIVTVSFAPYSYRDEGIIKGIEIDILREVFKDLGYKVNFYITNYKRAVGYVKKGIMDGIAPIKSTNDNSFYISEEPVETRIYGYAVLKNNTFKTNQCGYTGEWLKEILFHDRSCQWIYISDFRKGLMMLTHGRIKKLLIDKLSFIYYSKILGIPNIEFLPENIRVNTYIGFSRSDDYYRYLKDLFSHKLREYKTSGKYLNLLKKYNISREDLWFKGTQP